jgi:hypothetical protein
MKIRIAILSLIISIVTCFIAAQCVYRTVEKLRFKLLPQPMPAAKDGTASVRYVNPRPADARILAIRINNRADQDQLFTVRQNGVGIFSLTAEKSSDKRLIVQIPEQAICSRCRITILGQNPNWELHTVEVRNMYGFSSAWLKAVVIETTFQNYTIIKLLEIVLIFFLTFLVSLQLLSSNFSKKAFIPGAIVILLFAAVFLIPYLSHYKILLSASAFIKLWLIAFLPVWILGYKRLRENKNFKPAIVIAIVGLIFTGGMLSKLDEYDGNFSGFLHISKRFLGRNEILFEHPGIRRELIKVDWTGYDGQFFYFMAFDPLIQKYHFTSNPAERPIDIPVFRYRRIAYPVLAKLIALDNPAYYPAAMMFLIIAGAAFCGFFAAKVAVNNALTGWEGLACIVIPGFWFALSVGTPEPLAAAFLIAGFYLMVKKRYLISAIVFSMAILTRESAALFVVILAAFEFRNTKNVKTALILMTSLVPYIAWRSYVAITLFDLNGWSGFFTEPANLGIPFAGVLEMYKHIAEGTYTPTLRVQALALPILLFVLFCVSLVLSVRTKNPVAILTALYAFLALSLSYDKVWINVSNVERQSYESFLCFALLWGTRPKLTKLNLLIYSASALILLYAFFIMIRSDALKAGLLWLLKC